MSKYHPTRKELSGLVVAVNDGTFGDWLQNQTTMPSEEKRNLQTLYTEWRKLLKQYTDLLFQYTSQQPIEDPVTIVPRPTKKRPRPQPPPLPGY